MVASVQGLSLMWKGKEVSKTTEVLQGHWKTLRTAHSLKLSIFGENDEKHPMGVESQKLLKDRK